MEKISSGKVREMYDVGDGKLVIVTSDRISAFDVVLPTPIPNKGVILNLMSYFWFTKTDYIVKNHMISVNNSDMPEEFQADEFANRCMLVKKLKMLPIECIVRGYITGSGWESYKKSGSVCGISLPKDLKESEQLPTPIYTPTTKATEGHDEHISFDDTIKLVGEELATKLMNTSIQIYSECANYARDCGIIIADTKFEFGLDENGDLVLADEVLTPDSSRFWATKDYEVGRGQKSYDKQYLRDWLKSTKQAGKVPAPEIPEDIVVSTYAKYVMAYERLTGQKFV